MALSLPAVTAAQNGPGTTSSATTYFDGFGNPLWTKDEDGFLTYAAYDSATGAVTKLLADVDTTRPAASTGPPPAWPTERPPR